MAKPPNLGRFPADLRGQRRWVAWRSVTRRTKPTKKPLQRIHKPAEWLRVSEARDWVDRGDADGVGFVLGEGIVGIDLDGCIDADGTLDAIANDAIELATYVEQSPSGRGLHVWIRGTISRPLKISAHDEMPGREIYDGRQGSSRYLTVTGDSVGGVSELREGPEAQVALDAFRTKWFPEDSEAANAGDLGADKPKSLDDDGLLRAIFGAKDGAKWRRLYDGDWSDYPSQSEADLALSAKLRFYTRADCIQMDRLFRRSGLMRSKWDERHGAQTYGQRTIGKAIAKGGPVYAPRDPQSYRDAAERRLAHERSAFGKVFLWWALRVKGSLALRVLCVIASYADKNGEAFPAVETIAAHLRISGRRVYQGLNTLRAAGIVTSARRPHDSNLYRLALKVPETITPSATRRRASKVMEPSTLRVNLVVPTNRPRTDHELDTGKRIASESENEEPDHEEKVIAFLEPCIALRPSARLLRDEMLRGPVGQCLLEGDPVQTKLAL